MLATKKDVECLRKRIEELESVVGENRRIGLFTDMLIAASFRKPLEKPITLIEKIDSVAEYLDIDFKNTETGRKVVAQKNEKRVVYKKRGLKCS